MEYHITPLVADATHENRLEVTRRNDHIVREYEICARGLHLRCNDGKHGHVDEDPNERLEHGQKMKPAVIGRIVILWASVGDEGRGARGEG